MTPRASQGAATAFSRGVADTISNMIGMAGITMVQVLADAGISRNYYYKRARYELPFNTNDISQIAQALGIEPDEIIAAALTRTRPSNVTSIFEGDNVSGVYDNERRVADDITEDDHSGEDPEY